MDGHFRRGRSYGAGDIGPFIDNNKQQHRGGHGVNASGTSRDGGSSSSNSSCGDKLARPTQSSLAKSTADRSFKSLSARTSGRYQSFTQSMDLGPALRGPGHGGLSGIPRHQPSQQSMPPPPPPVSASSALVMSKPGGGGFAMPQDQQRLQRQLDAALEREAELQRQRHHMEANLHALRSTCDELTRGLSAARSGLETEREYQAKLQIERDELAGAVERLSSQMSDLQVSGSVAITTSEVCKVALTKAWTGAMDAIGGVQELQSQVSAVTAVKEQLQGELYEARGQLTESRAQLQDAQGQLREAQSKAADTRAQLQEAHGRLGDAKAQLQGVQAELGAAQEQLREREGRVGALQGQLQQAKEQLQREEGRVQELEARLARNNEELEQLLGKLCSTEDQLQALYDALDAEASLGTDSHSAALAKAQALKDSNAQLKGSLEEQGAELVLVRGRVAAYEEQLQRMQLRLRCGSTPGAGPSTGRSLPLDSPGAELQADALEQQVSKLATDHEQLEDDNLQLSAKCEELRVENTGLREQLREALLEAAAVTAAAERDASRHDAQAQAEASRLQQEAQRAEEAWRQQAEEAERSAEAARRRAEAAEQQLEAARSAQEAAGRQGVEDARAREELTARCEALEADIEAIVDKERELLAQVTELRGQNARLEQQLQAGSRSGAEAQEQLAAMRSNEDTLLQRIRASEADRQVLLRQLDEAKRAAESQQHRAEEAAHQAADLPQLRAQLAGLQAALDTQVQAAAGAAARATAAEAELDTLRAALERASQDARLQERREQQAVALRRALEEQEQQQRSQEAEMKVLRMQASENGKLRCQVEELSRQLAAATTPKPSADAYTQLDCTVAVEPSSKAAAAAAAGAPVLPPHLLHPAAAWASGHGPAGMGPEGSPLDRYLANSVIREDDAGSEGRPGRDRGQRKHGGRRFRPLRLLFGLAVKTTLVAGGMGAGLALSNPQGLQGVVEVVGLRGGARAGERARGGEQRGPVLGAVAGEP